MPNFPKQKKPEAADPNEADGENDNDNAQGESGSLSWPIQLN